jgi:hypothetical protein
VAASHRAGAAQNASRGLTDQDLEKAHAFAYGGSHIADLGYFPFGNREFTDLVHYVRSGDFVTALVRNARTIDELAFALGALAHWVGDTTGHAEATNRVVPALYPKLREQYGDTVTYADDHESHMTTEFRFDILTLARTPQSPDLFRQAIEFSVAVPLLDRTFRETYGLGLDDLFTNTDVAITTYRWGFRQLVQEATGIAWQLYRSDIQQIAPNALSENFVYEMKREDFESEFGKSYREAGWIAKVFGLFVKLVPDAGPFQRLPFKPLPHDVQEQFGGALDHATASFAHAVGRVGSGDTSLENLNLDTGRPTRAGEYAPADEAYAHLLLALDEHHVEAVSPELQAELRRYYADRRAAHTADLDEDDAARAFQRSFDTTLRRRRSVVDGPGRAGTRRTTNLVPRSPWRFLGRGERGSGGGAQVLKVRVMLRPLGASASCSALRSSPRGDGASGCHRKCASTIASLPGGGAGVEHCA